MQSASMKGIPFCSPHPGPASSARPGQITRGTFAHSTTPASSFVVVFGSLSNGYSAEGDPGGTLQGLCNLFNIPSLTYPRPSVSASKFAPILLVPTSQLL